MKNKSTQNLCAVGLWLILGALFIMVACGDNSKGYVEDDVPVTLDCTGDTTRDTSTDSCVPVPMPPVTYNLNAQVTRVDGQSSGFLDFILTTDATMDQYITLYLFKDGTALPNQTSAFQKTMSVTWLNGTSENIYTYFRTKIDSANNNYIWFAHDNDGNYPLDENTNYSLYYYDPITGSYPISLGTFRTQSRRTSNEPIREAPTNQTGAKIFMPYGSLVHLNLLVSNRTTINLFGDTINDINDGTLGGTFTNINNIYSFNNIVYDVTNDFQIQLFSKVGNSSAIHNNSTGVYLFQADSTGDPNGAQLDIEFY